ncbi:MAG TPA: hypothetical protein VGN26_12490 [Armatimonadota bacterium]|jgi:hypothetical protein
MDETAKPSNPPPIKQRRFEPEQVAAALRACHGLISKAATRLRCAPSTVRDYVQTFEECQEALRDAREALLDEAESGLRLSVKRKQPWAVCFALKCLGRERGYIERTESRQEVSGPNGGPIQVSEVTYEQALGILREPAPEGSVRADGGPEDYGGAEGL